MTIRRFSPLSAPIFALATFVAAITAISCTDLTGVPASLPTLTDSGVVYAINGAPLGAPTALQISTGQLVPASSSFAFDIAFDIDSAGHVLFMPLRTIASALAPTHAVGLQVSQGSFDNLIAAPKNGYRADTTLIGAANVTVIAQSNDLNDVRVGDFGPEPVRQGHRDGGGSRRALDEGRVHRRSELRLRVVCRRRAQELAHARRPDAPRAGRSAARWAPPPRRARRPRAGHRPRHPARA